MSKTPTINNVRYQHKHETEENWQKAINFIPLQAEIIVYDTDSIHKQAGLKIGDGKTLLNELPFYGESLNSVWGDFANNTTIPSNEQLGEYSN